jgi:surface-anchored protein
MKVLSGSISLLVAVLFQGSSAAAAIYSSGHGDFGVAYEAPGDWFIHYHLAEGTVVDGAPLPSGLDPEAYEFAPADVSVSVGPTARGTVGSSIPFLGLGVGDSVWVLGQNQVAGVPFFGIATEELIPAEWTGQIQFKMTGFAGPGHFALWNTDAFGSPTVFLQSNNGVGESDLVALAPGVHAHFNWGFTQPGTYAVELTVSGTHINDGLQSGTETVVFHVVPEPSVAWMGLTGMAAFLTVGRRRRG